VKNPAICDVTLSEVVMQLAMLIENVHVVHGLGCTSLAHAEQQIDELCAAYRRAASRVKPYLVV
jgi:hypothetical protein